MLIKTRMYNYNNNNNNNNNQLKVWFDAVDQDRSNSITPDELQRALVNGKFLKQMI